MIAQTVMDKLKKYIQSRFVLFWFVPGVLLGGFISFHAEEDFFMVLWATFVSGPLCFGLVWLLLRLVVSLPMSICGGDIEESPDWLEYLIYISTVLLVLWFCLTNPDWFAK